MGYGDEHDRRGLDPVEAAEADAGTALDLLEALEAWAEECN